MGRVPGRNGGTDCSHVLERNLHHFGWLPVPVAKQGWLSRFLGQTVEHPAKRPRKRSITLFITDGENYDAVRTDEVLRASQQRGDDVYFLFMAACEHDVDCKVFTLVAHSYQNTGLVVIRDLAAFVDLSDDALNTKLLVPELIDWPRK